MSSTFTFDLGHFATQMGWAVAGACDPSIPESSQKFFEQWVREYKPAGQMSYLEKRQKERLTPTAYFPDAKSILCFGLFYFPGWASGEVKVSNYAWGEDYHLQLKAKLEETAAALKNTLGDFKYRLCVDTAPVLEKTLAVQAGLGWQGKNTLLLSPQFGSYLFLGEIVTDLPLTTFSAKMPVSDHCGKCTRCIDACPTSALTPYVLKADLCISYLTLEHRGEFDSNTPAFSDWIAGCDICQEVCPWNQKLVPIQNSALDPSFQKLTKSDIESPTWPERIQEKALSYVRPENWQRNLNWIESQRAESKEVVSASQ
ncbi:MAG: tRNA epoxyqueuosine(34) reductase QueG [Deltaproteobacteria bacterium]|nr:tRNA epoxyqueuosine(34) reductase QueG [Deltaproteobacteria bacterium]